MKLYVDDIRECPEDGWTLCRSNLEAVRAISHFGVTIEKISLDHDISHAAEDGGGTLCSCAETFEVTARFVALLKRLHPSWAPHITIHTSNPLGAETMGEILRAADIEPVISLEPAAHR